MGDGADVRCLGGRVGLLVSGHETVGVKLVGDIEVVLRVPLPAALFDQMAVPYAEAPDKTQLLVPREIVV